MVKQIPDMEERAGFNTTVALLVNRLNHLLIDKLLEFIQLIVVIDKSDDFFLIQLE